MLNGVLVALLMCNSAAWCPKQTHDQSNVSGTRSQNRATRIAPIDLAKIGHIAPKGRVQDRAYNRLRVIEQLITNGNESIPFLIGQLESEKRVEGRVLDYWSRPTVGDIAFIILLDLFLEPTWQKSTVPGSTWREFLEVEEHSALTAEEQFRNYIAKHGRRQIKAKWRGIWSQNLKRLYWDENDRCFKLKPL